MRFFFALTLFVCFSVNTSAQQPEGQGYGLGMNSCATFAQDYRAQPALTEGLYWAWSQGFLSGMNLMATVLRQPVRHLAKLNVESAKIEIRTYCSAHPLEEYYSALTQIYGRLPLLQ